MEFTPQQISDIVSNVMLQMQNIAQPSALPYLNVNDERAKIGTGGNDPFDKEYPSQYMKGQIDLSPYQRTNKILRRIHALPDTIDSQRALMITEAFKKYENDAPIIKAANVLAYLLHNLPVDVYEDELIVGDMGCPPRCAPLYPEFSLEWICDEMINFPIEKREQDRFVVTDQTKRDIMGIRDYWKGRTVEDNITKILSDEEKKGSVLPGARPVFHPNLHLSGGIGHFIADYETLFKIGFTGIRRKIEAKMEELVLTDPKDIEKREFYNAVLISLDAVKDFFYRYGAIARQKAGTENNPARRQELLKMAENVEWVAENPPRTFWEAMQLYHLATNVIVIDSNGHSIGYGRFDQMLYPFYARDMKSGLVTKQFVAEIIESWCIKTYELLKFRDRFTGLFQSEAGIAGTTVVIGGLTREGKDATNDLSYLMLEAHAHTYTPDPWLSVRWHDNTPWEFKVKTVNVIRIGTGQPKLFNDEVNLLSMMEAGRTLAEARDYSIVGCVEPSIAGKEYGEHDACYFSVGKVFELSLNDGRCIDCGSACPRWNICGGIGERLGIRTGSLADFKSYEEAAAAYRKQLAYWVNKAVTFMNAEDIVHNRLKPLPYISAIIDGCIDQGIDASAGGAIYNFLCPQIVGPATVADGLCTIKQLVFEEKKTTGAELLQALHNNWEGFEALYELVNSEKVHHYGNDDEYADEIAHFVVNSFIDEFGKYKNARGGKILAGCLCGGGNLGLGSCLAATPDGRKAYEPVSNSINPVYGSKCCHDFNGPTAVLKSVGKLDSPRMGNGTLLNMKFSPNVVSGEVGRDNLIRFLETLVKLRVQHVQLTLQDKQTLIDAKAHPENYSSLLVRVAAYSAYFTRLSPLLQDEVINRHEHDSFE